MSTKNKTTEAAAK